MDLAVEGEPAATILLETGSLALDLDFADNRGIESLFGRLPVSGSPETFLFGDLDHCADAKSLVGVLKNRRCSREKGEGFLLFLHRCLGGGLGLGRFHLFVHSCAFRFGCCGPIAGHTRIGAHIRSLGAISQVRKFCFLEA